MFGSARRPEFRPVRLLRLLSERAYDDATAAAHGEREHGRRHRRYARRLEEREHAIDHRLAARHPWARRGQCLNLDDTVFFLKSFFCTKIYLGDFPEEYIVEGEARMAQDQLRTSLGKIEAEITERNRGLEVPYTYLLPSRVPRSIAV